MVRKHVGESLRGAVVVLIASPPDTGIQETVLSDAQIVDNDDAEAAIDEAALALARAVLAEGGTLAVRGNAYAAPLVAYIAAEYWSPAPIENVQIADTVRTATVLVYGDESSFLELVLRSPVAARREMSAIAPVAVVLLGGGASEREEANYWQEKMRSELFFPISGTGGAAAESDSRERYLTDLLRKLREELRNPERGEQRVEFRDEDSRQFGFSHYPLLMRQIVDDIVSWWREHNGRR